MTRVEFYDQDGRISGFCCTGHSGYAEAGADVDLTQFTDAEEIDADAEDAVRWAYASDLLTEKDGKLRVQEELSRKELSRMLEDLLALSSAD